MGNRALTTFSPNLMPIDQLPKSKADNLTLPNLPLTIMFYNEKLTPNDIRLTLLGSPVLSLMIGVLCYYMLLLRQARSAHCCAASSATSSLSNTSRCSTPTATASAGWKR